MNNKKILSRQKKHFFIEKFIIIIVMFMFVLLVGLNTARAYNYYFTAQFFEFNAAGPKNNISTQGIIEITIEENKMYPMLKIIVNGEPFDYKFEENNRVIMTVYNGDVIQVNGSMYKDNIKVEIKDMSANVSNVLSNNHIILKEGINTLAIIRI